jgi:hypothetical protein
MEDVTFTAEQIGGEADTVSSEGIRIIFNRKVTGLTINDITIVNGTGKVVPGALSGTGAVYTVALNNITAQGDITISIGNFGTFNVTTKSLTVAVYRDKAAPPDTPVKYGDLDSNGEVDEDDLILMLRYFARPNIAVNLAARDVNGDGIVDTADLIWFLRFFNKEPGIILGPKEDDTH